MFSGIIADCGHVISIAKTADWRFVIGVDRLDLSSVQIGDSIACSGVCLTVVEKGAKQFVADVSAETLSKTTLKNWQAGTPVNLELSLRLGDVLGGHLVYGHVDKTAEIQGITPVDGSRRFTFKIDNNIIKYVAVKGSITVNGVSLTVNDVRGPEFDVNVIPHTMAVTDFKNLAVGQQVNIEVDIMARYAERLMSVK